MKLTEETKAKIQAEYEVWKYQQYSGKDKKERQKLGQFFTPPALTIRMLEKFDSLEKKTILDPACGNGNLLAAAIIAGADPNMVYGNEYDPEMVKRCQERLAPLGVPAWHIHEGNALDDSAYDFKEDYTCQKTEYKGKQKSGLFRG